MPGVPESFIRGLDDLPRRFSRSEAIAAFTTLRESSVTVYLSHLVKSGHLIRVGPKEFEKSTPTGSMPLDSVSREAVRGLKSTILPSTLSRTVVWSSESLAAFLDDAILQPFVVLEAPKDALSAIRDKLGKDWNVLEPGRAPELGSLIWEGSRNRRGPDLFLRANNDLRGTLPSNEGPRAPGIERLFVEVMQTGPSHSDILFRMATSDSFGAEEALHIAGARNVTAKVASFLTLVALRNPKSRVGQELRNRFAHLRSEVVA